MKSFGVCVGLVLGLASLPALAASAFDLAQATPAAPGAAAPPAAAAPSATAPAATAPAATAPATAAPARPKVKATAKAKGTDAKKTPSVITVENKRTVTLKGLQISLAGGKGKVVGKLAKEVAGGKSARVALKGAKGCEYDVKWEFEDATDESTADLCNDPRIVLTD
jgi:pyruvate/2-oxoglutarate dehydrogenase complex dihydrolipoamide acyltransferase (E2) component